MQICDRLFTLNHHFHISNCDSAHLLANEKVIQIYLVNKTAVSLVHLDRVGGLQRDVPLSLLLTNGSGRKNYFHHGVQSFARAITGTLAGSFVFKWLRVSGNIINFIWIGDFFGTLESMQWL